MLGGDFNLGDIEWDSETVDPKSTHKSACDKLIHLLRDHQLSQLLREHTRENRLLDLFCTNKPSLVKSMSTIPGISDHDAIIADSDIKPAYVKKKPRSIFIFSKANWAKMREDTTKFATEFLRTYRNTTVEENWASLKLFITQIMATHIPTKTTSKRQNLPWLSGELKRQTCKKHRMYKKCKAYNDPDAIVTFKKFKKETAKARKKARVEVCQQVRVPGV